MLLTLPAGTAAADVLSAYKVSSLVLIKNTPVNSDAGVRLRKCCRESGKTAIAAAWTGERPLGLVPDDLGLFNDDDAGRPSSWYASMVFQQEEEAPSVRESMAKLLGEEGVPREVEGVDHDPVVWIFVGCNVTETAMRGRAEHVDDVGASGTWHKQLSGRKDWRIRPLGGGNGAFVEVRCEAGDLLFLDTSTMLHQTSIPGRPGGTKREDVPWSISVAREFYLPQSSDGDQRRGMWHAESVMRTTQTCALCGTAVSPSVATTTVLGEAWAEAEAQGEHRPCGCMCCCERRSLARAWRVVRLGERCLRRAEMALRTVRIREHFALRAGRCSNTSGQIRH